MAKRLDRSVKVTVGLLMGVGCCWMSACDSAPETNLQAVGGSSGAGGSSNTSVGGSNAGSTSVAVTLPALHVEGAALKDPNGKTIVLRGVSLLDIGQLYNTIKDARGITARIDKVLAAGLQPRVIRLPVYPRTVANGNYPAYSSVPYPLGPTPTSTAQLKLTPDEYLTKVLKPTVDYVIQKGMYAIVDYHQIDDTDDSATGRGSAADATEFWKFMAAKFKDYPGVIYEAYNEPMDRGAWSTLKPRVQTWIDTIRAAAPNNVIIVPSPLWCQKPGDAASDPPTGTNLMYTAHVYPGNWTGTFETQVSTAASKAPVFFTEWGYSLTGSDQNLIASSASWGTDFKAVVDASGGSWTAWVTDNSWQPALFSDAAITNLTEFGTLTKNWLAEKYTSDWVE